MKQLISILRRHTGRDIADLRIINGHWYALTAYGWQRTTTILDWPKNPGASGERGWLQ